MPSIQIRKKKKIEVAFALSRSKVLVLILGALMSAIFGVIGILYSFCEFSGKQKNSRSEQNKYTTFIHSSWDISERRMGEINILSMCHIFVFSAVSGTFSVLCWCCTPLSSSPSKLKFLFAYVCCLSVN